MSERTVWRSLATLRRARSPLAELFGDLPPDAGEAPEPPREGPPALVQDELGF